MARQRQTLDPSKQAKKANAQSQLYGVLFMASIVMVITLAAYFFLQNQPREVVYNCDVVSEDDNSLCFPNAGQQHISDDQPREYNSNPPTSGNHNSSWVRPLGTYTEQLNDYMLVHNLEHGHVWISYRDEDDQEAIDFLRSIQEQYRDRVIVTYRPENDARIAVAAWTRLLNLDELDAEQIESFIANYSDKAPESILEG